MNNYVYHNPGKIIFGRETERSVADIAQAVGYDSPSRFSAAFKETYGVLPREYRRSDGGGG